MTLDKSKAFTLTIDKDDDAVDRAFRVTRELMDRIIEAENVALMNEINANAVVINGRKYGMIKHHPGLTPTIFGMRAYTRVDMPDDWDFFLQERPPLVLTNADRIRSMTDEELADFLGGIFTIETDLWGDYDPRLVVTQEPRVEIRDKEGMMGWLKSPTDKEGK